MSIIPLCLLVYLFAGLCRNYSTDFWKKNLVEDGTRATEETVGFWWLPGSRYVRVRITVRAGFGVTVRWGRDIPVTLGVLPVICLTVTGSAAFAEVCALQNAILVMSSPL